MKLSVILVAATALCAVSAIPLVPRDNSHYIEGESRYIWMPDDEGNQYLIDLKASVEDVPETRNGGNNAYWLYTRRNRNSHQLLRINDAGSIRNSHYNGNRATKVLVHGWNSNGNTNWVQRVKNYYLDVADVNVIVVDWRGEASHPLYIPSANAVPGVGRAVARFLNFLFDIGQGNWNNLHLIGHSLGAHVVGNAGRAGRSRPPRVTGLDPAGPEWGGNSNALNRNSGAYVESIHTNGGRLGINDVISHADFYPNGGREQPGCGGVDHTCHHRRAPLLFAVSMKSSHLVGRRCSNLAQANRNQCTGGTFPLGNINLGKRGSGIYALTTRANEPY